MFFKKVLFPDKTTFCLIGHVLKYPAKLNVWARIIDNRVIGIYLINETVTTKFLATRTKLGVPKQKWFVTTPLHYL